MTKRKELNLDTFFEWMENDYHDLLESLSSVEGMTREVQEGDGVDAEEGFSFMWTKRGMTIIENLRRRLGKIVQKNWPDEADNVDYHSMWCQEL